MFRPNWSCSGVQVVMIKDSATHCNAVFFRPMYLPLVCVSRGCFSLMCGALCWIFLKTYMYAYTVIIYMMLRLCLACLMWLP
jgi:hypothetical protein